MRQFRCAVAIVAAMGCGNGGETDTDASAATCDDYETAPLSTVDSTEWPAGLAESLSAYQQLDGIWEASDCVDPQLRHRIKILAQPQEQMSVILQGVPESVSCGCVQDPDYGHDNTMDPVAFVPTIEVFIPEGIDPGVDFRTYEFSGALFGPGQPLSFRACGNRMIDPADGSEYDEAWLTLSATPDDTLTLDIKLAKLGQGDQAVVCELTDWVRISDSTGN